VGVREYWIVDAVANRITVLRREESRFGAPRVLSANAGDVLVTGLLPGLQVTLSSVLA
jgi:Uma2 family endonuclease